MNTFGGRCIFFFKRILQNEGNVYNLQSVVGTSQIPFSSFFFVLFFFPCYSRLRSKGGPALLHFLRDSGMKQKFGFLGMFVMTTGY